MYRLSLIISEIYNKYLPLAEKGSIALNLDFSDTTKTVDDPETIKSDLEKHLSSALDRSNRGEISIAVEENAIVITDSGTILSKPVCALLSKGRVNVASRVGFGTTVSISLLPPPPEPSPDQSQPSPEPSSPTLPAKTTKKSTTPTAKKTKKTSASAKPTREQRKLISAAKKADRKIQKLRKSQQKQVVKKTVKPQPTATKKSPSKPTPAKKSTTSKKPKKTRKKILELS